VTGNEPSMDFLAWYVDTRCGDSGFSPHRDRQPDNAAATFRKDGTAKFTTCWVPLSDATPDNSCLYVIPRRHDPGYTAGPFSRQLTATFAKPARTSSAADRPGAVRCIQAWSIEPGARVANRLCERDAFVVHAVIIHITV
jgi:ectoine hydroxylase-related dioxygenase (phytanoyl-CoA dioxygenase family)